MLRAVIFSGMEKISAKKDLNKRLRPYKIILYQLHKNTGREVGINWLFHACSHLQMKERKDNEENA